MSQDERYGSRDLTYSRWHRWDAIQRFVGWEAAQRMSMIDVDIPIFLEYAKDDREPLVLCEAAVDVGQTIKPATVTRRLAMRCDLPAFTVLYTRSDRVLECDVNYRDIDYFRVKKLWPHPESDWCGMTPERYAQWMVQLRARQSTHVIPRDPYFKKPRWRGTEDLVCPFCGLNYGAKNGVGVP